MVEIMRPYVESLIDWRNHRAFSPHPFVPFESKNKTGHTLSPKSKSMRRSKLLLVVALLCVQPALYAQSDINSPYSSFGIGDLQQPGINQVEALGGAGIGLRSSHFINLNNPAALNSIQRPISMIMDFGLNIGTVNLDSDNDKIIYREGTVSHLSLWFRYHPKWAGILSLTPYSKMGYTISSNRYSETIGGNYTVNYQGNGGLSNLQLGNAFELLPGLSLGANINFRIGSLAKTEQVTSDNEAFNFDVSSKTHLNGLTFDAGFQYTIPLKEDKKITFGATYEPSKRLNTDEDVVLTSDGKTIQDDPDDPDYVLPSKLGGGLSFQSKKWLFSADAVYQDWSNARLGKEADLVNTLAVGGGVEYAIFDSKYKTYQQAILLRFGYRAQNHYVKIDGEYFYDWQASAGVSLPFNRNQHYVHLNYLYSQRRTAEEDLYLETRHKISVSFSLQDIWFMKRKLE